MKFIWIVFGLALMGCATNTANLPQLTCPEPLTLPAFTDEQLAELETVSRETQLLIMKRDSLQAKRREMLQRKCRLFDGDQ